MKITGLIWVEDIVQKLLQKHRVQPEEVEEVLSNLPGFSLLKRATVRERMFTRRLGKQTPDGT